MIRVRVHGGWTTPERSLASFLKYTERGSGRWKDIQLVSEGHDVLALFNAPRLDGYDPATTIVFESEPRSTRDAEFHYPYPPSAYKAFYDLERHHGVGEWFVHPDELEDAPAKTRTLSTITSGMDVLPRHRLRRRFVTDGLRQVDALDDFGRAAPGFEPRRGALERKVDGLLPYRYTFAAENTREPNYFTEKILDAILCETLAFYDGCPNLELFVDPAAFVPVDMARPSEAITTIRDAIRDDLWSRRREALHEERVRLQLAMNPIEVIRRVIHGEPVGWRPEGAPRPVLPLAVVDVEPADPGSVAVALHRAAAGDAPTLVVDRAARLLASAPEALGALVQEIRPAEAIVVGGTGLRSPEAQVGTRPLGPLHTLRPLLPGAAVHVSAFVLTPRAATRMLASSSPGAASEAAPHLRVVDPPLAYAPGPHMSVVAWPPGLVRSTRTAHGYETAHRLIKRLPRGQRIARSVTDVAWSAWDGVSRRPG
jgi:hypothetical protein